MAAQRAGGRQAEDEGYPHHGRSPRRMDNLQRSSISLVQRESRGRMITQPSISNATAATTAPLHLTYDAKADAEEDRVASTRQ